MQHRSNFTVGLAIGFSIIAGLAVITASCVRSGSTPSNGIDVRELATKSNADDPAEMPNAEPQEVRISIENFTFNPATVTVPSGAKVTWINHDDVPHTVRSNDDLFRSDTLDTDDEFSHVFDASQTFEYYCGVHPHMAGKVIVR